MAGDPKSHAFRISSHRKLHTFTLVTDDSTMKCNLSERSDTRSTTPVIGGNYLRERTPASHIAGIALMLVRQLLTVKSVLSHMYTAILLRQGSGLREGSLFM